MLLLRQSANIGRFLIPKLQIYTKKVLQKMQHLPNPILSYRIKSLFYSAAPDFQSKIILLICLQFL